MLHHELSRNLKVAPPGYQFFAFRVHRANMENQTSGTPQFNEGQTLSVTLRLFLGVSCKHPAEIGKPIEIT